METKKSTEDTIQDPPTPVEVCKLLGKLVNLKSHAISATLECSKDQADEISRAVDDNNIVMFIYLVQVLGDKSIATGVKSMKEAL